jgi:hypothetical protein
VSVPAPVVAAPAGRHLPPARPQALWQAELRAMPVADSDVFDEVEYLSIPGRGSADVGHGQHRSHSRVRR